MSYTEIINITYDLADELKESFEYKEMIRLDIVIKSKYKEELKAYQKSFLKFDEVFTQGGKYHPDFKEVSKKYRLAKEVLFNKEEVKTYFELESKINEILGSISEEVCNTVSKYYSKGGTCSWL